jgi:hypothetical protein
MRTRTLHLLRRGAGRVGVIPLLPLLPRSEVTARWPGLAGRVDQATTAIARVLPACRHVLVAGAPPLGITVPAAIVCAICRDRIACKTCHNSHVDGLRQGAHNDAAEHTCDACGQVVERLHPVAMLVNLTALTTPIRVRGLDGRKRQIVAPLGVAGIGLCRVCMEGPGS